MTYVCVFFLDGARLEFFYFTYALLPRKILYKEPPSIDYTSKYSATKIAHIPNGTRFIDSITPLERLPNTTKPLQEGYHTPLACWQNFGRVLGWDGMERGRAGQSDWSLGSRQTP